MALDTQDLFTEFYEQELLRRARSALTLDRFAYNYTYAELLDRHKNFFIRAYYKTKRALTGKPQYRIRPLPITNPVAEFKRRPCKIIFRRYSHDGRL